MAYRLIITNEYVDFLEAMESMKDKTPQEVNIVKEIQQDVESKVKKYKAAISTAYKMIKQHSHLYEMQSAMYGVDMTQFEEVRSQRLAVKELISKQFNMMTSKKKGGLRLDPGFVSHVSYNLWKRVIEDDKKYKVREYLIYRQAYQKALFKILYRAKYNGFLKYYFIFQYDEYAHESQSAVKLKLNYYGVNVKQQMLKFALGISKAVIHILTPDGEMLHTEKNLDFDKIKKRLGELEKAYEAADGRTKEGRALKKRLEKVRKLAQKYENVYQYSYKNEKYNDIFWDIVRAKHGEGHAHTALVTDQDKLDEYKRALQLYVGLPCSSTVNLKEVGNIAYKNKDKFAIREADWETYKFLKENNALELKPNVDDIELELMEMKNTIQKLYSAGKKEEAIESFLAYEELAARANKEYGIEDQVGFNPNMG